MRKLFRFYGWGMSLLLHAAVYALAMILCKCVVCLIMKEPAIEVNAVLEMLAMSVVFVCIEAALFPRGIVFAGSILAFRTAIWVALCNLLFAAGAMAFRWYPGIPLWGSCALLLVLELCLTALWFGSNVVLRIQNAELGRFAQKYQNHS
ncbi:MAG: hypothetical protein ACOX81_03100 [Candidatus Heteroscillospira sp.]|jgi:hypothetical protein